MAAMPLFGLYGAHNLFIKQILKIYELRIVQFG